MTVPGIGTVVSFTDVATIDILNRSRHPQSFGEMLGFTLVLKTVRWSEPAQPSLSTRECDSAKAGLRGSSVDDEARGEMVLADGRGNEYC